ncbi:MAG: type II toxin-antitoxin system VapC family toxin [Agriterribacter sp.]
MADKKLMIDTSILIDYFRKTDKSKSRLVSHFQNFDKLYISTITEFEIFNGASQIHKNFWDRMLTRLIILDFDRNAARKAAEIVGQLKVKRKTIDKPDLFIAATAIVNNLPLDTLNMKHFADIEDLNLFDKV